jgi:hypothetical protein
MGKLNEIFVHTKGKTPEETCNEILGMTKPE